MSSLPSAGVSGKTTLCCWCDSPATGTPVRYAGVDHPACPAHSGGLSDDTFSAGPIYVPAKDPQIRRILDATFPNYRKPDVTLREFCGPMTLNSYWDGGSKDEYAFFRLDNGKTATVPTSHPFFDRKRNGERLGNVELTELPENVLLVRGGVFCGKPSHITIYVAHGGLAPLLPAPQEPLPTDQQAALNIIAGIKSGYRQDAFDRAGLGQYTPRHPAIVALAESRHVKVNKAGAVAVTTKGRNTRKGGAV